MEQGAIIMFSVPEIPVLKGALLLFGVANEKDPIKTNLSYILAGAIVILIILEAGGYQLGLAAQTCLGAFTMMLGYWFRAKEEEAKLK